MCIWDLAPHDLSIMDYLIKEKPEAVVATGERHLNGVADMAFITLYYPNNMIAHINVNWLSPVKVRTTLIGGEKKMLVWNDLEADEKIEGVRQGRADAAVRACTNCWSATAPATCGRRRVEQVEALKVEAAYFVDCILNNKTPFNDGLAGLRVVRMLEAADQSLQAEGENHPAMNEFVCIAPDVKLGKNVKLSKFINLYGCEIGDNTKIGAFVEIQKNATVGKNCKISSHTFICEGVTIEDDVFIGHGVTFINDTYPRATAADGQLQTEADWKVERTLVKKGASIGSGSTILANVAIGENAIVGAGSVVTKDVPANRNSWHGKSRKASLRYDSTEKIRGSHNVPYREDSFSGSGHSAQELEPSSRPSFRKFCRPPVSSAARWWRISKRNSRHFATRSIAWAWPTARTRCDLL